jgi:hypothetical protein
MSPSSRSSFFSRLCPLLRRQLGGAGFAALQAALAPKRDGGWVLASARIERFNVAGCFVDEALG